MSVDNNIKPLEDKVSEWLSQQGYRLEYLTHKDLMDAGLHSTLGNYVESAEGQSREIDVSAFGEVKNSDPPILVKVLCECKYSKKNPWVLLSSRLTSHLLAD